MRFATRRWGWTAAVLLIAGVSVTGCTSDFGELHERLRGSDGGDGSVEEPTENPPLRVDAQAAAGGDGLSWETAYADLQAAVDAQGEAGGGEVWVARGTYTPTEGASEVLTLRESVEVYGGFAGDEAGLDERNLEGGLTRLDAGGAPHVVRSEVPAGRLDGLVLTGGAAEGAETDGFGGGIYIRNATSDLIIANCEIVDNASHQGGAGMYVEDSSPTIRDTLIDANSGLYGTGGVYNVRSLPTFTSVTVSNNSSVEAAGGMVNRESEVSIVDCTFDANNSGTATKGGAIANLEESTLSAEQSRFISGSAEFGHGGHLYNDASSQATLEAVRMVYGHAEEGGGALANAGELRARDCTIVRASGPSAAALRNVAGGRAELVNSTIARSHSFYAHGEGFDDGTIYNAGTLTMTNVTLVGSVDDECSPGDCGDGVHTDAGGETTAVNVASWGVESTAHANASVSLSHSCVRPEEDERSFEEVDTDGDGEPEVYLTADSPCRDLGLASAADEAGVDWANLTTHASGCLDSSPADPGHHHASSADDPMTCSAPEIATSEL